jgi:hypothetical protein
MSNAASPTNTYTHTCIFVVQCHFPYQRETKTLSKEYMFREAKCKVKAHFPPLHAFKLISKFISPLPKRKHSRTKEKKTPSRKWKIILFLADDVFRSGKDRFGTIFSLGNNLANVGER